MDDVDAMHTSLLKLYAETKKTKKSCTDKQCKK